MRLNQSEIFDNLIINIDSKKCFIFDLDGTIIFDNKFLSPANEALLRLIHDAGHKIIFATGRPLKDFKTVMPVWTHTMPLTVFSGSVSVLNEVMIRSHEIPRKHVEEILEVCLINNHAFVIDNLLNYYHPDTDVPLGFLDINCSQHRIQNIDDILNSQIFKILLFDLQCMGTFAKYANENDLLIKHHSYSGCFDIVPAQCNKYLGVLPFINSYKNEDVFIFGNDYNDYELLKNFNNSILFGNIEELQKLAKLNLSYNDKLQYNFTKLIHGIIYGSIKNVR